MKLPAFQFYPGDWMKDANLRRCSAAARGIWIDLLCLMFEADERGKLVTGALPWTLQECAEAVTGDPKTNLELIRELIRKGVAKQDENGALFSKRLIKDENERKKTKERVHNHRDRNGSSNGVVTPSVTPSYEDEVEDSSKKKNQQIPQPSNSEEITLQIFQAHPGNAHLGERISPVQLTAIVQAIGRDGAEKVLRGVKAFASAVKALPTERDREMTIGYQNAEKFWATSEYLKPKYQPAPKSKHPPLNAIECMDAQRLNIWDYDKRPVAEVREEIKTKMAIHVANRAKMKLTEATRAN